jgi:UDP-N-acetylmuramoyl-tripeptide--D-alanyl-D-alanine ligase
MMRLMLSEMAEICGGRLHGEDCEIHGMIHDSRALEPGMLFAALPGERVDGHDFVATALAAGAAGALVSRTVDAPLPQLVVENVLLAMGQIAAAWRRRLDVTVVGVTGSNGKTTVKEMLTAILSSKAPTLATAGNYNNEIGLPLTLARLGPEHRYAVLEMGASRAGDIAYLAELARPDIGLVNNAGPAHLEGFGSLEGVARAKGEMYTALAPTGCAVINVDDPFAALWRELAGNRASLGFGFDASADVRGAMLNSHARIKTPAGSFELRLALPGRHNVMNALAATAVACHLNLPLDEVAAALNGMKSLAGRFEVHEDAAGWRLVDDTYNANPASLYAGLQVLVGLKGRPWLVLGDMAELGPDAARLHAEMGQSAADLGVERLFAVGPLSAQSAAAFGRGAEHFESHQALLEALVVELEPGINCLVKGSRSMAMERIVQALIGEKV